MDCESNPCSLCHQASSKVHGHALNGGLSNGHLLLREHRDHGHHGHQHHAYLPHATAAPAAPAAPPQKAEKRSRHKDGKGKGTRLYLKHLPATNNISALPPASPLAAGSAGHGATRYKSLNNIHGAMELDGLGGLGAGSPATTPPPVPGAPGPCPAGGPVGTLDSSHSGGRTSGDSGPGNKLPEKRSRKLSRPR